MTTEPYQISSRTPRFGLPFLFPGQGQKEFHLNECIAILDVLLHPVVNGILEAPPSDPEEGSCWLVASKGSGEWSGKDDYIACFQAGIWLFVKPMDEMRVFDKASGTQLNYQNGWHSPITLSRPSGGSVIDIEARETIAEILDVLRQQV